MFELDPRLKTFVAAAETGSFAQAAEWVFVSSTAVMKQINQLEDAVGVALFRRSHQGLTLTPAGESFLSDVRQLQKDAQTAVARARAAGGDAGTIRIGTSPMTPARVLIDLWPKVHAVAPNLRFSLVPFENTPANARANLTGMGRDMDMVAGFVDEGLLKTHGCAGLALYRTPLCVAVPLDHPLAGKKSLVPRDLYGETLLIVKRGYLQEMDALRDDLEAHHPRIRLEDFAFHSTEVFNQCENGGKLLIAIKEWQDVHPLMRVLPVRWGHTIPFGLLHSPTPTPRVQACIDAICQAYQPQVDAP